MNTNSIVGRSLYLAAALSFASAAMGQAPVEVTASPISGEVAAPSPTIVPDLEIQPGNSLNELGEGGVAASDAELERARGGIVWVAVFYIAAANGARIVLRTCTRPGIDCVRGAAAVLTSPAAARRYVCRRWGKMC